MKLLVLALCVSAAYAAYPPSVVTALLGGGGGGFAPAGPVKVVAQTATGNDYEAPILRSESDVNPEGFNYAYETGNGISAQASGALKKVDNQEVIAIQGEYQYTDPEGKKVGVRYVADENGYQPQSDLLPVAPEIPPAILRSLEYIAAHPQPADQKYKP